MLKDKIEQANKKALDLFLTGRPTLVDVRPALDVVPGMKKNMVLHSAPPVAWADMCGPHRHGVIGAVLWEGLADNATDAQAMIEAGDILIEPCHHHDTVGAGTGITSASTPMLVVDNLAHGNRAFSCLSEGGGLQLLKWGSYDDKIAAHMHWQAETLAPVLQKAVKAVDGVDIKNLIAKAVQMGDECHNRSIATNSLFFNEIAVALYDTCEDRKALTQCVQFLTEADQFFLHGIMAGVKAMLDAAANVEYSTMVTAMARNGVEFGIRVSGLGDEWYTAPANNVDGLFFRSEWGPEDAAPDLGDSAITETAGLGGFIQAAAPTVQSYVNGSMRDAIANTQQMATICIGANPDIQIPTLDFAPAPVGIDIRKVVKTGVPPLIDTAITHREQGLIGAGQVRAPMGCFESALKAFSSRYAS
ncbi:DUF1116 domain-containing protein [Hyphococcus sp.]|uniref:DUF1116 domain-containing protein n=1 Tax=Hyphococcus sp. TaxID=2038636 RepID=UPI003CCBF1BC